MPKANYIQEGPLWFGLNDRLLILKKGNYIEADLCYFDVHTTDNWANPLLWVC
jgi:hypothetical protein